MPRTETIVKEIFTFDELDDSSKETAREWWREGAFDFEWWDSVYDDAKTIGGLLGIEISNIFFSGFWSQGDGACFEGFYSYKKGAAKAVKEYAPLDTELHAIANSLQALQRPNFYKLTADVKQSGHYSHENCTSFNVRDGDGYDCHHETEESLTEILRDYMRWIYAQLESEHEYLTSDESVDESIRCNEYEFTENGERY